MPYSQSFEVVSTVKYQDILQSEQTVLSSNFVPCKNELTMTHLLEICDVSFAIQTFLTMFISYLATALFVAALVIGITPWWEPRDFIPAGTDPLIASRYQIVVMLMLVGLTEVSSVVDMIIVRRRSLGSGEELLLRSR
jgi:ABC-type iron transport system FetAB permease component